MNTRQYQLTSMSDTSLELTNTHGEPGHDQRTPGILPDQTLTTDVEEVFQPEEPVERLSLEERVDNLTLQMKDIQHLKHRVSRLTEKLITTQ